MSESGPLVPQAWFGEGWGGWRAALITSERRGGGAGILSFQPGPAGVLGRIIKPRRSAPELGPCGKDLQLSQLGPNPAIPSLQV